MEKKYYLITVGKIHQSCEYYKDDDFIIEATRQKNVFTEKEFLNLWKNSKISPSYQELRIL